MFKTVVKIGGSITEKCSEKHLLELGNMLSKLFKKLKNFVIVPGGAFFVELIRETYKKYNIDEETAHWMAIHAVEQNALFLKKFIPNSDIIKLKNLTSKNFKISKLPIVSVLDFTQKYSKLEHTWNSTSDAIASEIAIYLKAKKIIFVKDIEGINVNEILKEKIPINELNQLKTSPIDRNTPKLLTGKKIKAFIVNGFYLERLNDLLLEKENVKAIEFLC